MELDCDLMGKTEFLNQTKLSFPLVSHHRNHIKCYITLEYSTLFAPDIAEVKRRNWLKKIIRQSHGKPGRTVKQIGTSTTSVLETSKTCRGINQKGKAGQTDAIIILCAFCKYFPLVTGRDQGSSHILLHTVVSKHHTFPQPSKV